MKRIFLTLALLGAVLPTYAHSLTSAKEAVVKLLWQDQALQVLEELGADVGVRSKTRKEIYARLAECADLDLIRAKVRHFLSLQKGPQAAERQK